MRLSELPAGGAGDWNADVLEACLKAGAVIVGAAWSPAADARGATIVLTLRWETGDPQSLTVGVGPRCRALLAAAAPDLGVDGTPSDGDASDVDLAGEVRRLLAQSASLAPEARAALLMDHVMALIAASRCALVPLDPGGTAGDPLAFHVRGGRALGASLRHLPRAALARAARTRQPVSWNASSSPGEDDVSSATTERQRVTSLIAVPIVLRGELLGAAYVDRLGDARPFTWQEQAVFEGFAYELARPLVELRAGSQRLALERIRDDRLASGRGARAVQPSPALALVLDQAERLAPHRDLNLLLLGETGAGKEWLALRIHEASGATGAFVPVNVTAIPPDLFESELMGSQRGAFTGAVDRAGLVRQAEGGTLFLDEVGDLELSHQVKLLRFLQDKRASPLGGRTGGRSNVRVIAATNRPVARLVHEGSLRSDLVHRFAPPLVLPPLRDRREEILPLAREAMAQRARLAGVPEARLTPQAERLLVELPWPGNVRQLQTVVGHAVLLCEGGVVEEPLLRALASFDDAHVAPASGALPSAASWKEFEAWRDGAEAEWLRRRLDEEQNNVEATARALGMPATTLRYLVKKHDLRNST